jgi:hypothetical protein
MRQECANGIESSCSRRSSPHWLCRLGRPVDRTAAGGKVLARRSSATPYAAVAASPVSIRAASGSDATATSRLPPSPDSAKLRLVGGALIGLAGWCARPSEPEPLSTRRAAYVCTPRLTGAQESCFRQADHFGPFGILRAMTSARKWERDGWITRGWIRRTAGNLSLLARYFAGAPPERLYHLYNKDHAHQVPCRRPQL